MARTSAVALLALLLIAGTASGGGLEVGKAGGDFSLVGGGETVSLRGLLDRQDTTAVVVAVTSYTCPYSLRAAPEYATLFGEYSGRGVASLAVYPNRHETEEGMRGYAKEQGISHTVLRDPGGDVARDFGAEVTPTFFVFDKTGYLRYRGNLGGLASALDAVLAGEAVANPITPATGCTIKWPGDAGAAPPPRVEEPRRRSAPETEARLSESAAAWLDLLLERLGDEDRGVVRSAAAAITALGKPALPRLQRALQAAEGERASILDRLVQGIGRGGDRRRGPGAGGRRPFLLGVRMRAMAQNLDLSPEQQEELETALEPLKEREREILRLREEGDQGGFRAAVRELMADAQAAVAAVLTPEQKVRLEELRREWANRRRGSREGRRRRDR